MNDRWYYSHDGSKFGPCSGRQLRELASCGHILRTDTIWKEGIERGVMAVKVKNLFKPIEICQASNPIPEPPLLPPAPDDTALLARSAPVEPRKEPLPEAPVPVDVPPSVSADTVARAAGEPIPGGKASPTPVNSGSWQQPTRKGRAVAGRGAILVGQDGVNVKYRKKCTTCGTTESSWTTMPIRNGVMRVGYFCLKCRKHREVEVHGSFY